MSTVIEPSGATPSVTEVSPSVLNTWLSDGTALLIDVREDFEHADERIEGAALHPLSKFDADAIRARHGTDRIVFHCRSGKRSLDAARRFGRGEQPAFHLVGGIEAWKAAGLPVVTPPRGSRLPIMRQVQIGAGALVVAGIILGVAINPWLLAIPAFVGCGLIFAGASGWCGMAKLLAAMPWNKHRREPTAHERQQGTGPMNNAATHYQNWPHVIKAMKDAAPQIGTAFGGMFQKLMSEGALSVREKELVALGIGMATRCEPCVYAHTEKAVKAGATREQLLELAGVVVVMQGGPGYVHVPELIDAMDALGV